MPKADKKPKADISWITDELLNALAWQESKFDPKAQSKSGAMGLYQWMPAFFERGEAIGFGVPTGKFDPTDPVESRKRTKAYLEGLQKYYPTWDPTEVLMAYNWGHSNVNKLHTGQMNMDEYMAQGEWERRKAAEAMNYAPKILKHLKDRPYKDLLYRLEPTPIQDLLDRGEPSTYMLLDEDPFASTI